jgi:hypothetical protein
VLGLFRDLLVFKVAKGEDHLFEGAAFSRDEMQSMAAYFAEADLLRFFNSLAETEASLREAVHPRYVLEIGLVKLIEMRSVTSMESILERLDALAAGTPLSEITTAERSPSGPVSAPVAEKKTLKTEPVQPASVIEEPKEVFPATIEHFATIDALEEPPDFEERFDIPAFEEPRVVPAIAMPPRLEQSPIRLRPLSSEELEHHDNPRLDDAYEERLLLTGDDLLPIGGADTLIKMLFGESESIIPAGRSTPAVSATAAAAKPAFDVAAFKAEIAPADPSVPLPELSSEPTADELEQYARAHPAVRSVMRVFRAKVVEIAAK